MAELCGPGETNLCVNKPETAVQLRYDMRRSRGLPDDVRAQLERVAGSRPTQGDVLIIVADRYRSQLRNREDALERLVGLIRDAAVPPVPGRATKPTAASKQRRLEGKAERSDVKKMRGKPVD